LRRSCQPFLCRRGAVRSPLRRLLCRLLLECPQLGLRALQPRRRGLDRRDRPLELFVGAFACCCRFGAPEGWYRRPRRSTSTPRSGPAPGSAARPSSRSRSTPSRGLESKRGVPAPAPSHWRHAGQAAARFPTVRRRAPARVRTSGLSGVAVVMRPGPGWQRLARSRPRRLCQVLVFSGQRDTRARLRPRDLKELPAPYASGGRVPGLGGVSNR
jgi:hypothetical protein